MFTKINNGSSLKELGKRNEFTKKCTADTNVKRKAVANDVVEYSKLFGYSNTKYNK